VVNRASGTGKLPRSGGDGAWYSAPAPTAIRALDAPRARRRPAPSYDSDMILPFARYLEVIRREGDLMLSAAAPNLDAPVANCQGWKVRDLLAHVGVVHREKEQIIRERFIDHSPGDAVPTSDDSSLVEWYRGGLDSLVATLAGADPATPVFTWYSPDQTVGFWYRRMAHENAIHRADADAASGPISPLDAEVAADGIDEVLGPIICAYSDDPRWHFRPDGRGILLRATDTGREFRLLMGEGSDGPGWMMGATGGNPPETTVAAPAWDLDLWAWGRLPATGFRVEGDVSLLESIRYTVTRATQ
jgi:uncharacterized protein (TIGR03083 family)